MNMHTSLLTSRCRTIDSYNRHLLYTSTYKPKLGVRKITLHIHSNPKNVNEIKIQKLIRNFL